MEQVSGEPAELGSTAGFPRGTKRGGSLSMLCMGTVVTMSVSGQDDLFCSSPFLAPCPSNLFWLPAALLVIQGLGRDLWAKTTESCRVSIAAYLSGGSNLPPCSASSLPALWASGVSVCLSSPPCRARGHARNRRISRRREREEGGSTQEEACLASVKDDRVRA